MKTAQTTARTAREMFYFVDDVQRMLGYSRSKSYKIIKQLNDELEAQGKHYTMRIDRPQIMQFIADGTLNIAADQVYSKIVRVRYR